jgi:hypothetical protein
VIDAPPAEAAAMLAWSSPFMSVTMLSREAANSFGMERYVGVDGLPYANMQNPSGSSPGPNCWTYPAQ